MKSLHDNQTFELVKLLKEKKVLQKRWVYRLKYEESSQSLRYKVRLVVKGYG
ncbi:Retrovirus-related Pol polyprotein [Arachis hypogaea]|nr:Retrovirus-related Pol polyprotein [Arachis hypogaea]